MSDILADIAAYKRFVEIPALPEITEDLPPSKKDFAKAISASATLPHIIAEVKPASPVTGRILPENADIAHIAQQFQNGGVAAISVLTDEKFFQGSFANLQLAANAADKTPILCKDFILSAKQIRLARAHGADSFLLIAKILEATEIQQLLDEGRQYKMEALVEIADEEDLHKVLQTDAKLVGINNRDLRDFSLDLKRTFLLAKKLPSPTTIISLSGFCGADVRLVKSVASAVLAGTSIGKASDIPAALKRFLQPKPLIKLCGVRNATDAEFVDALNIDLLGLNFVPTSKRCVAEAGAEHIVKAVKHKHLVGVFQNQSPDYVQKICSNYKLTFAQLSGSEAATDFTDFPFPIIKGVSVSEDGNQEQQVKDWESVADIFLFDGKNPGAGKTFPHDLLPQTKLPFLVAGGISSNNAAAILHSTHADGIDTASGIENVAGEWDYSRIRSLISTLE